MVEWWVGWWRGFGYLVYWIGQQCYLIVWLVSVTELMVGLLVGMMGVGLNGIRLLVFVDCVLIEWLSGGLVGGGGLGIWFIGLVSSVI